MFDCPDNSEYTRRQNVNEGKKDPSTQRDRQTVSDSAFGFPELKMCQEKERKDHELPGTLRNTLSSSSSSSSSCSPNLFLQSIIHPSLPPHHGRHASQVCASSLAQMQTQTRSMPLQICTLLTCQALIHVMDYTQKRKQPLFTHSRDKRCTAISNQTDTEDFPRQNDIFTVTFSTCSSIRL